MEELSTNKIIFTALSKGINPITQASVDDKIESPRITKHLLAILGELSGVNDGIKKIVKINITDEQKKAMRTFDEMMPLTKLVEQCIMPACGVRRKPLFEGIRRYLIEHGFLAGNSGGYGPKYSVTPKGIEIGILEQHRQSRGFDYVVLVYTTAAQQFIINNLDTMV